MTQKHKIILDTDPGIDDAMAIFTALSHPQIELLGLTTTFGNVSVERATRNALTLLEHAGVECPVASGVARPLVKPPAPFPDFVHGVDGLGNLDLPEPSSQAHPLSAAEFIVDQANRCTGELSIVAIGPLGNLAAALELDPSLPSKVKQVVLMGGVIASDGNVSPVAEANILSDPHAADRVMEASWPVTLVGLDVTHQIVMPRALFEEIADQNTTVGELMRDAAQFYIDFYQRVRGIDGCYAHDVTALAYLVMPDRFTTSKGPICVATDGVAIGQTIQSRHGIPYPLDFWDNRPSQSACLAVDAEAVLTFFRESILGPFWAR